MYKTTLGAIAGAIGMAALVLPAPAQAGNGAAVGAGLAGFGIGAIVGNAVAPWGGLCRPATCLLRAASATCLLRAASATCLLRAAPCL